MDTIADASLLARSWHFRPETASSSSSASSPSSSVCKRWQIFALVCIVLGVCSSIRNYPHRIMVWSLPSFFSSSQCDRSMGAVDFTHTHMHITQIDQLVNHLEMLFYIFPPSTWFLPVSWTNQLFLGKDEERDRFLLIDPHKKNMIANVDVDLWKGHHHHHQ